MGQARDSSGRFTASLRQRTMERGPDGRDRVVSDTGDQPAPTRRLPPGSLQIPSTLGALARKRGDINLPDEQKGKPVGTFGGTLSDGTPFGRTVMGGDDDDPRWIEHRRRLAAARARRASTLGGLREY